jgi:hypothetical protein
MVDEMLELCLSHGLVEFNVTFAVRACDVIVSLGEMQRLLDQSRLWSLTLWNGNEGVNSNLEKRLKASLDCTRYANDSSFGAQLTRASSTAGHFSIYMLRERDKATSSTKTHRHAGSPSYRMICGTPGGGLNHIFMYLQPSMQCKASQT